MKRKAARKNKKRAAETVRYANTLAFFGADTIFMPEHVSDSRGIFVRFVTKYKKDSIDPNKYQGSQIDLGKNMLPEEARIKMQNMMESSHPIQSLQSNKYKDAFAFALHEKANIQEDVVQNSDKPIQEIDEFTNRNSVRKFVESDKTHGIAVPPRDPRLHTEEKIDHSVLERAKNTTHRTDFVGDVVSEGVKIGRKVVFDTKMTFIAAGFFAIDALKKRKKKGENKSTMPFVDKIRSVFVHKKEQFYELRDRQLKEILHHVDHRIREAGKQFVSRVVARWQEMMAVKSMFAFAAESGVGIGVALLGLKFMSRELPEAPKKRQLESRFLKDRAPKNLEEWEKVQKSKRERAVQGLITSVDKITLKRYFVKKEKRGVTVLLPVVDTLKRRFLKKHEARVILKEKNVRAVKPVDQLWKTLHLLTRRVERFAKLASQGQALRSWDNQGLISRPGPATSAGRLEAESLKVKKEGMAVMGVWFAWIVWVMLGNEKQVGKNVVNFSPVGSKLATFRLEGSVFRDDNEVKTPWILFAIIWHLAMIRESGFGNKPINQYTNTTNTTNPVLNGTNKQRQWHLLPQGVIFAYAS